jgi:hypothetical protein
MINLPASLQDLVGRKLKRISIADDRSRIIFDTWESPATQVTRYSYSLTGVIDRFQNYSSMVGYTITAITALDDERNGQQKFSIHTVGQDTFGVIYLSSRDVFEGLTTEDDSQLVGDPGDVECLCFVVEDSGGLISVDIEDIDLGRNPPYMADPAGKYYIVEEGDVNYGLSTSVDFDCDEECA